MQLPQPACDPALLAGGTIVVEFSTFILLSDVVENSRPVDPADCGEPLSGSFDGGRIDPTGPDELDAALAIDGYCGLGEFGAPELGKVILGSIQGTLLGNVADGPVSLTGPTLASEGGAMPELPPGGTTELAGGLIGCWEVGVNETGDSAGDDTLVRDTEDVWEPAGGDSEELGEPDVRLAIDGCWEFGNPELGTVMLGPIDGSPLGVTMEDGPGSLTRLTCEGEATPELPPDGCTELVSDTTPELVADGFIEPLEVGLDETDEMGGSVDDDTPD